MQNPYPLTPITLWKEKWPREALIDRHNFDPRSFERGFRQNVLSEGDATFPAFEKCRQPIVLGEILRNNWPTVVGVDLSGKKRPGNAIVAVKVEPITRRRYPVAVQFGAWKGSELCERLQALDDLLHPIVFMVEDNGYQESLIDWVSDQKQRFRFWMKVEPTTTTGGKKASAELGLPALQVEFHHDAWVVPYLEYEGATPDEDGQRGWWARWDREFALHPVAANTDGVMATWFARQGIENFIGEFREDIDSIGDLNAR
jgi:hypothetical protein